MSNNNQLFKAHKKIYISCNEDTKEVKKLKTYIEKSDTLTILDAVEEGCIYITDQLDEKVKDSSTYLAIFVLISRPDNIAKDMMHIIFEPDAKRLMYRIHMIDISENKMINKASPSLKAKVDKNTHIKTPNKKATTGKETLKSVKQKDSSKIVEDKPRTEKIITPETIDREKKELQDVEQGPSFAPPMDLLESSLYIQQQVMLHQRAANNMTIGVWSPMRRSGVTTFIMNYAMYLGANNCLSSVLELPGEEIRMLDELTRFSELPAQWSSYAQFIQGRKKGEVNEPLPFQWEYKKVYWYPLASSDHEKITWHPDMTRYYIRTMQRYDVTLIDLPTGPMSNTTKCSLDLLDELWIIINDDHQYLYSYVTYIQNSLEKYPNLKVFTIFNNEIKGISKSKDVSDILGYPLLTSLPDVNTLVKKNHYAKTPLFQNAAFYKEYEAAFVTLTKHLKGETFKFTSWKTKLKRLLFS